MLWVFLIYFKYIIIPGMPLKILQIVIGRTIKKITAYIKIPIAINTVKISIRITPLPGMLSQKRIPLQ